MMIHPAAPAHSPWFIPGPDETDWLMVFTGVFLVLFVVIVGVLYLRLLYLPMIWVSPGQKAKAGVVGVLSVLAMVRPGNLFWVAAVLIATIDIPDFPAVFHQIANAARRISEIRTLAKSNSDSRRRKLAN